MLVAGSKAGFCDSKNSRAETDEGVCYPVTPCRSAEDCGSEETCLSELVGLAGSPDADACDKMGRFVDLCDTFHVPVVNFVDNPGFLVGTNAEKRGTIRKGVRALGAVYQASVPWCSTSTGRGSTRPSLRTPDGNRRIVTN